MKKSDKSDNDSVTFSPMSGKYVKCNICKKKFSRKQVRAHRSSHVTRKSNTFHPDLVGESKIDLDGETQCPKCGKWNKSPRPGIVVCQRSWCGRKYKAIDPFI